MANNDKTIREYKKRRTIRLMKRVMLAYRMDAKSTLVYGLCKGAGIDTKGMDPEAAWKALKEKTGKEAEYYYNQAAKINNVKALVSGPKATKKFIADYVKKFPSIKSEAKKYMDARSKVANFLKDHPDAKNYNTYTLDGKLLEGLKGAFVTFHQNAAADDPFGGYNDEEYALMCEIAKKELGAKDAYIGYFGNPEISFNCSDLDTAMDFAVKHNQNSVYNGDVGLTIYNKQWDSSKNPIRGIE